MPGKLGRDELLKRVWDMYVIFMSILNDPTAFNNLDAGRFDQLHTGVNKAYAQAKAFEHESLTVRAAKGKAREVTTQKHADVSVGRADALFAKTIECKSVTDATMGAVNTQIGKAITQLGKEHIHQAREHDVRVIDVVIHGVYNPWPLSGGAYGVERQPQALEDILQKAETEVYHLIFDANKPGAKELMAWLNGENFNDATRVLRMKDLGYQNPTSIYNHTIYQNPHSSRLIMQNQQGQSRGMRCLTIKIRYHSFYRLNDPCPANQRQALSELVFQVFKGQQTVEMRLAKFKVHVFDSFDRERDMQRVFLPVL